MLKIIKTLSKSNLIPGFTNTNIKLISGVILTLLLSFSGCASMMGLETIKIGGVEAYKGKKDINGSKYDYYLYPLETKLGLVNCDKYYLEIYKEAGSNEVNYYFVNFSLYKNIKIINMIINDKTNKLTLLNPQTSDDIVLYKNKSGSFQIGLSGGNDDTPEYEKYYYKLATDTLKQINSANGITLKYADKKIKMLEEDIINIKKILASFKK